MARRIQIVQTHDGSKTLYDRDKQVHYRAMAGARSESRYVFLEGSGLLERPAPWRVLELGFGAGVNFCETVRALGERPAQLEYHSVEYAAVAPELLEFHQDEAGELARRALAKLDRAGEPVEVIGLQGRVRLWLYPMAWLDFDRPDLRADAVFYDPFGPRTEPGSWGVDSFAVARQHMAEHAVLATYSAATAVKRAMFEAGFEVASAPGPGRKREVTFASTARERLTAREHFELLDAARYVETDDA
jgi:tRNA U34 5-methylaminomethyl-2-thiouridine-forming methyltransferase MnmC